MASVHRDPRFPKGVWYCSFTIAGGRRVVRSTGTKNKTEARILCESWEGRLSKRKTFTIEEVAKLIETARGSCWEGAILFGYSTGARLQDVANLRWDSIDLENRVVVFRQCKLEHRKSGSETVVGIHDEFTDWLLRVAVPDDPQSFVFPGLANRSGGGKNGLSNAFSDIVRRAGIDPGLIREKKGAHGRSRRNLTFHALRHGAASHVFNATVVQGAAQAARQVTGHARAGSLSRYVHRDLEAIRATTALIPRLPLKD